MGFRHTFVEIEVIPPFHRHNIPEPHVGDLVRLGSGNVLLSGEIRLFRINQECAGPTSDQALQIVRWRTRVEKFGQLPSSP